MFNLEEQVKFILEDNLRLFPWRVVLDKHSAIIDFSNLKAIKEGKGQYIETAYFQMLLRIEALLYRNIGLALTSECEYTRTFAEYLISLK